eukprot:TRINITY_DN27766_c0_g1_i1.p1 TRINITY_DN27766_c0_g1~~TRINITY_DN27766_c0_g1_i1.p1  ORF type:complete len:499 (+),score=139.60 TRINITY_DN27766_c0_g1_i1:71-1567(+)
MAAAPFTAADAAAAYRTIMDGLERAASDGARRAALCALGDVSQHPRAFAPRSYPNVLWAMARGRVAAPALVCGVVRAAEAACERDGFAAHRGCSWARVVWGAAVLGADAPMLVQGAVEELRRARPEALQRKLGGRDASALAHGARVLGAVDLIDAVREAVQAVGFAGFTPGDLAVYLRNIGGAGVRRHHSHLVQYVRARQPRGAGWGARDVTDVFQALAAAGFVAALPQAAAAAVEGRARRPGPPPQVSPAFGPLMAYLERFAGAIPPGSWGAVAHALVRSRAAAKDPAFAAHMAGHLCRRLAGGAAGFAAGDVALACWAVAAVDSKSLTAPVAACVATRLRELGPAGCCVRDLSMIAAAFAQARGGCGVHLACREVLLQRGWGGGEAFDAVFVLQAFAKSGAPVGPLPNTIEEAAARGRDGFTFCLDAAGAMACAYSTLALPAGPWLAHAAAASAADRRPAGVAGLAGALLLTMTRATLDREPTHRHMDPLIRPGVT